MKFATAAVTFLTVLSLSFASVVFGLDDTCTTTEDTSLLSVRSTFVATQGRVQGEVEARRHFQEDTEAPVVRNPVPADGTTVRSSEHVFAASVSDPSGIRSVKFNFRDPSGVIATVDGVAVVGIPEQYSTNMSGMTSGDWMWRIKAKDDSAARNAVTTPWYNFHVTGSAGYAMAAVRAEVQSIIEARRPLAAKFVRLGFHDCVGGCDGCVDLDLHDNFGLDVPIAALDPVVDAYANVASGLTRADIWAFAALLGAELSQPSTGDYVTFPMTWFGRQGCEHLNDNCFNEDGVLVACDKTHGPHRVLPGPDLTTAEVVLYFDQEFGYTARDTVAIMGAHTIGAASRSNSGFQGQDGWVNNKAQFNNGYYDMLVGGTHRQGHDENSDPAILFHGPQWTQEFINNNKRQDIPSRYQWFHTKVDDGGDGGNELNNEERFNGTLLMLNSDISMVRDLTDYLNPATGEVTCQFRCTGQFGPTQNCDDTRTPVCPVAAMTFDFAAEYKYNSTLWINDFRRVFLAMLVHGYEDVVAGGCDQEPCPLH